jgi:hypothetical protein
MRCGRDNGMIYFFRVNFIRKVTIEAERKIESNQIKSNRRCVLFHRDSFSCHKRQSNVTRSYIIITINRDMIQKGSSHRPYNSPFLIHHTG